jgi:hypothetical protein
MNEILDTVSISDIGSTGILVVVVILILRGRLVSSSVVQLVERARDFFENAYRDEYAARIEAERQRDLAREQYMAAAKQILDALPVHREEHGDE